MHLHQLRRRRFHAGSWLAFAARSQCRYLILCAQSISTPANQRSKATILFCCSVISLRALLLGRMRGAGGGSPHLHSVQYAHSIFTGLPQWLQASEMPAHLHSSEQ